MNCKDLISKTYKSPRNKIFTVCYIGGLHRRRFFPDIVDTIGQIENIKFVIGAKKEHLKLFNKVKKNSSKYGNVEFLGQIPKDEVVSYTCKSDVVLCPLDPNSMISKIATANKQFEAMVCGRPIICTKNTNPGDLTDKLQCGIIVDYDLTEIKRAIVKLSKNPELCEKLGRNALKAAVDKYNWQKQKNNLLNVYRNLN